MIFIFFNTLALYFLHKSIFGFKLDTSRLPFSIIARFGLFYGVNFWWHNEIMRDIEHNTYNREIDLIIPILCDIKIVKQL